MTGFTSLLSSIGGQSKAQTQQTGLKSASQLSTSSKTQPPSKDTRIIPNNAAAGVKRKSEEPIPAGKPKVARISSESTAIRPAGASASSGSSTSNAPYRGTARSSASASAAKIVSKPVSRPPSRPSASTGTAGIADSTAASRGAPKRGFASIMEKAKAAQEAAKATGSSGIKHKAVERTNKRDRQRQLEEAQHKTEKVKKSTPQNRNGVPAPVTGKTALKGKASETAYKGTMKKAPTQLAYKGTMRALPAGAERPKPAAKKGMGQDKYGGYASWSDLDDAEDDEEDEGEEEDGGAESDASSDMEAGWGDTEREELHALRYAKQEDQQALEEEERLKREKLERKRRLQELSKSNAAKRKY